MKVIQKFVLVRSDGCNRHVRSVVAQIYGFDITIEYWTGPYLHWGGGALGNNIEIVPTLFHNFFAI